MPNTAFSGAAAMRLSRACGSLAGFLVALTAMASLFTGPTCIAQDSKTPSVLPAPSSGKAIVCIYRVYRFTGSAAHDEIFVNDTHLGKLLNGEYEFTEVPAGTVVIAGLPKMYYGGIIQSTGAALAEARKKENERARFEAEAGKTYYFKWTSGAMATGIKVTPVDPAAGAKEMSKLHLSKPPEDASNAEAKDAEKPAPQ
jgi:hypothetical protein